LLEAIAAKKAEYAAFAGKKTTYEAAKTAYNTALDAAEKLKKDTLSKDIFRLASPTDADKKILNAVPKVPQKPSPPAAYSGAALATKTGPTGAELKNVVQAVAATPAANLAGGMGAWGLGISTEFNGAQGTKDLTVGKAWGTNGWGVAGKTAAAATAADASMIATGRTASKYLVEAAAISPTTCVKHYMLVQAGVAGIDDTITADVKITLGVAEFAHTLESPGSAPGALEDPKTPSTGAKMLGGLAAAAVMLTLY